MKSSGKNRLMRGEFEADSLRGPRPIGELMPAVLARHGIDLEPLAEQDGENPFVLIRSGAQASLGIGELLAMM
jgi:hypothetical protein